MHLFFLFSGIAVLVYNIRRIRNSPAVSAWSLKRWYTTLTIFIVSAGFLLLGLEVYRPYLRLPAHYITALGMVMMIATPCSIRGFNENKTLRLLRGLAFFEVALIILTNLN